MERILKLYRQNIGSDFLYADHLRVDPFDPILQRGWNWIQQIDKVTYRTSKGLITNIIRKTPTVLDKNDLETVFKPFIIKHLMSEAFVAFFRDTILPMMRHRKSKPKRTEEELFAELRQKYLKDRKTRRYMYVKEDTPDPVIQRSVAYQKNSIPSHSSQSAYVPPRQESPRKRARQDTVASSSNDIPNMSTVSLPAQLEDGETRLLVVTRKNDTIEVDGNMAMITSTDDLIRRADLFLQLDKVSDPEDINAFHIHEFEKFKQFVLDLNRSKEILQQYLDTLESYPEKMQRFINRYIAAQEEKERKEREEREEAEQRRKREEERKDRMLCELLGLEYIPQDKPK